MKRILPLILMVMSFQVYGTNGDNMIAAGSVSRAMGGVGFAYAMGSESILKNPALMTSTKTKFELSFGGMLFKPQVTGSVGTASADSDANTFVIPAMGFTYRLCKKVIFGVGAYGVSGLGVDYRKEANLSKMSTALNLMKFAPALAYQTGNFSIGVGASILYGTLGMSYYYNGGSGYNDIGRGVSDDLGFGFDIGMSYAWNDFTVGLNYKSSINMSYDHQIANAATDFMMTDVTNDKMEQPAEYGVGVAYSNMDFDLTADYKIVSWSKADGYKEFGWEDQSVLALGFAYHLGDSIIRLGYNHATTPLGDRAIRNSTASPTSSRNAVNFFNLIGFPATSENHYTVGFSHQFSSIFGMDFSCVLSPEESVTAQYNNGSIIDLKTTHKETSFSAAGRWTF